MSKCAECKKFDDCRTGSGLVWPCGAFVPKKPMTNADRIRAMTDEELAHWLADIWDCQDCSEHERLGDHPLLREERCDQKCEQHCLEWLQQPVKGGADHE